MNLLCAIFGHRPMPGLNRRFYITFYCTRCRQLAPGGFRSTNDSGVWLKSRDRELARRVATRVQQASLGTVLTESELVELVEDVLRGAP